MVALTSVNLCNNGIGNFDITCKDEVLKTIAEARKSLVTLDISNNNIGKDDMVRIYKD